MKKEQPWELQFILGKPQKVLFLVARPGPYPPPFLVAGPLKKNSASLIYAITFYLKKKIVILKKKYF